MHKFIKVLSVAALVLLAAATGMGMQAAAQEQLRTVTTIPLSNKAKVVREHLRQENEHNILAEENYAALLQAINKPAKNTFPKVSTKLSLQRSVVAGSEVYTMKNAQAECLVFYIHGGSYAFGLDPLHVKFCEKLADKLQAEVYLPLYPLAPQATYKEAYACLDAAYQMLEAQNKPILLMGDSAGGGLALAYAEYLRDMGKRLPRKLVLFSPWVDVTMSNPDIKALASKDVTLREYGLVQTGRMWAGAANTHDPHISPIYGNLENLPPVLLFTGTDEIFFPDINRLYELLQKAGNKAQLVYGEGLWHVFVVSDIPETKTSLKLIRSFCKDQ